MGAADRLHRLDLQCVVPDGPARTRRRARRPPVGAHRVPEVLPRIRRGRAPHQHVRLRAGRRRTRCSVPLTPIPGRCAARGCRRRSPDRGRPRSRGRRRSAPGRASHLPHQELPPLGIFSVATDRVTVVGRNRRGPRAVEGDVLRLNSATRGPRWLSILRHWTCRTRSWSGSRC